MDNLENHFDNFTSNLTTSEIDEIKDVYVINGDRIRNMSHKVGALNAYTMHDYSKKELRDGVIKLTEKYKKIILFCPEEFGYEYESVKLFVELCLECGVKLFIYSFNSL